MSQLPILAVAFAIYILGIALILYLRPALMFKPGGSWKEFGIGRGETHTVLPFWLFAIFWAFMSYGVSLVILSQFANMANASLQPIPVQQMYQPGMPHISQHAPITQAPMSQTPIQQPQIVTSNNQPANYLKPVSSMIGLQQNTPGYYVLANNTQNGNPQYIYYGSNPPNVSRY
jgi:hypothetical protein